MQQKEMLQCFAQVQNLLVVVGGTECDLCVHRNSWCVEQHVPLTPHIKTTGRHHNLQMFPKCITWRLLVDISCSTYHQGPHSCYFGAVVVCCTVSIEGLQGFLVVISKCADMKGH